MPLRMSPAMRFQFQGACRNRHLFALGLLVARDDHLEDESFPRLLLAARFSRHVQGDRDYRFFWGCLPKALNYRRPLWPSTCLMRWNGPSGHCRCEPSCSTSGQNSDAGPICEMSMKVRACRDVTSCRRIRNCKQALSSSSTKTRRIATSSRSLRTQRFRAKSRFMLTTRSIPSLDAPTKRSLFRRCLTSPAKR